MLYLISTPIGNLNDISLRAIEVLKDVDYIFAEDTRNTSKLLKFINCEKRCKSLHEHNEQEASNKIINILRESDNNIAVVSDAGTPAISDPGYYLIQKCIDNDLEFTLLPGPSSIINALVLSGLPTSSFSFLGFVPRKKSQKIQFFQSLKKEKNTINQLNILYNLKLKGSSKKANKNLEKLKLDKANLSEIEIEIVQKIITNSI